MPAIPVRLPPVQSQLRPIQPQIYSGVCSRLDEQPISYFVSKVMHPVNIDILTNYLIIRNFIPKGWQKIGDALIHSQVAVVAMDIEHDRLSCEGEKLKNTLNHTPLTNKVWTETQEKRESLPPDPLSQVEDESKVEEEDDSEVLSYHNPFFKTFPGDSAFDSTFSQQQPSETTSRMHPRDLYKNVPTSSQSSGPK